jgi:hypothetical protein
MFKRLQTRVPAEQHDGAFVNDHLHSGGRWRRRMSRRNLALFGTGAFAAALALVPAAQAAVPDARATHVVNGRNEPLIVRFGRPAAPTADQEFAMARIADQNRRTVAFVAAVEFNKAVEFAAAVERARQAEEAQQAQARRASASRHTTSTSSSTARRSTSRSAPAYEAGSGRCGGDLPPCSVMQRESGGNIRAQNPSSSASGKWQFIDSTWNGYGGYASAADAPEAVQDAKARELWAGGAGCGHWTQTASGC